MCVFVLIHELRFFSFFFMSTRCRGNIILELDESNATRLLLDRLKATTLTKDKEYFLATGEPATLGSLDHKDMRIDIDMVKKQT